MFFNNFQQNLSHMQVIKEQTGEASATIEIRINKNDYEPEINKALKDYQRKAAVPGFRQGKVPFGIVRKMYGQAMLAEQVNKLVSDTYSGISLVGY
jgi:trigger factor